MNTLNTLGGQEKEIANALVRIAARKAVAVKAGPVQLTKEEAERVCFSEEPYIVSYKTVYYLRHSKNAGIRAEKVRKFDEQLTKRGRFQTMSYKAVNKLIGFELLISN